MKSGIIIAVIIVGVIGTVAIFASVPSDTWQDHRTDVIGVAPPDENKEKIDCMSIGGYWDGSCSIEKQSQETQETIFGECSGNEACLKLKVSRIIDGDTIYADSYKIRLSLVDTPEKGEPGYFEATAFTTMTCPVGSMILVDQDDLQPYDNYDRLLGKVYCGHDVINETLLVHGHGSILTQYCDTSEFSGEKWAQSYGCEIKPQSTKSNNVLQTTEPTSNCDRSYPTVCIPPYAPDLNCGDIPYKRFKVLPPDPHGFDRDKDGIGCES